MPLALTTFWEAFFLFMIWVPLVVLWASALIDIITRPDIRGLSKVLWILCVLVVPYLGALIYLVARPRVVAASP